MLRQVPLRGAEGEITGYVDLVSERAYRYEPGQASDLIKLPEDFWDEERATRTGLVEKLADFDDKLLEQLLEDVQPSKEEIYQHLTQNLRQGRRSCRCFSARGSPITACAGCGRRCATRRRCRSRPLPRLGDRRRRRAVGAGDQDLPSAAYRQAVAGAGLARHDHRGHGPERHARRRRVAGDRRGSTKSSAPPHAGEVVGLTRMEDIATGVVLTPSGKADPLPRPERPQPVFGLAIASEKRDDDVKLTGAIGKLIEEDPTFELDQNADTQEMVLWGQGDIHLQIAMDRLRHRHNLAVTGRPAAGPL